MGDGKQNKTRTQVDSQTSDRSDTHPPRDIPNVQENHILGIFRPDKKTVFFLISIFSSLIGGWVLHQFATQFDQRFPKAIAPTNREIEFLKKDFSDFKNEHKESLKEIKRDARILDDKVRQVEIVLGGKK